jgi:hypothetical protein
LLKFKNPNMIKNYTFKQPLILFFMSCILSYAVSAQVGIGTTAPRGALDIVSTTQGFVPPQVALTANNVAAPVVNPQGGAIAAGTIIYNNATAGTSPNDVVPGYYYWNGSLWVSLSGGPGSNNWSITGNSGINPATNFVGTTDAIDFATRTSNTERMRVSSTGNVGIGTPVPTNTLDVNGGATLGLATGRATFNSWFAGNNAFWINLPTSGPSGIGTGGAGANAWIAYAAGAGNWFSNAAAGDIAYRNTSGKLLFGNTPGNAGMALSGDRLGIGTVTPSNTLDVNGGATLGVAASRATFNSWYTGNTAFWINLPTSGPSGIGTGGAGANPWLAYASGAGEWFSNAVAGDIVYRNTSGKMLFGNTAGNAGMALSSDRLGIGTITPNASLHVNGTTAFTIATSGTANTVILQNAGTFTPPVAAAGNSGVMYIIRNTSTTTNLTVATTIPYNSATSGNITVTPVIGSITIISDGTNWYRIH